METLEEKSRSLLRYIIPVTVGRAKNYLTELFNAAQMLSLYEHFFPVEFTASTASFTDGREEMYSSLEIEFLKLINQEFFPLLSYFSYEEEERTYYIPIISMGVVWRDGYDDDIAPGCHILLEMLGELDSDDERINQGGGQPLPDRAERIAVLERFSLLCKAENAPLSVIPEAIDCIFHDTGNIWLDISDEMWPDDIEWTVENIEVLRAEFKEAQTIMARVEALFSWLAADKEHFEEVLILWRVAHLQIQKERSSALAS